MQSLFSINLKDETKEKETLTWENTFYLTVEHCTFINCHIVIKNISNIEFENNNFVDCTFDLNFPKYIRVNINDNFVSYPENVRVLDECVPKVVPVSGGFYAYKYLMDKFTGQRYIAKLWIPADARRSSAGNEKCRAERALVVNIWHIITKWNLTGEIVLYDIESANIVNHSCMSALGKDIKYEVGQYVIPDSWDDNRFAECTHGIHFFLDLVTVISKFITNKENEIHKIISSLHER